MSEGVRLADPSRPAVILGRGDGIWARTLARAWIKRGVPTVIVSTVSAGALPDDIPVVVVQWRSRPWVARLRRVTYPLLAWVQERLVQRGKARFSAVAGVPAPERWEYDFIEPFWNAFLLRQAASRLNPLFVFGQEVHSHGLATALCTGHPRYLFPWGSDVYTVVHTSSVMNQLVRFALRNADLVVPTAISVTEYLSERFGVAKTRIRPVSWGVDRALFRPAPMAEREAIRSRLQLPADAIVVVNARRFLPQWQSRAVLEAFIQCARRSPRAHFLIIGGGYASAEIRKAEGEVASAGLSSRFTFAGDLSLAEYREHLACSDAFVSMNPAFDMRSVSVLQGLACRLIPVLSEHPEYRAMQAQGFDALFVPPGDAGRLEAVLGGVLADPRKFEAMVAGNERYVEQHEDGETQMDRLLHLLLARGEHDG